MYYQLSDYKDIILQGFGEKLKPETISAISTLCTDMNVAFNANKLHDFSVRPKRENMIVGAAAATSTASARKTTSDDWESLRSFKATPILKKEGFDKQLNDICVCLNKISAKNSDTQYTALITIIRDIFNKYDFDCEEGQKTIKTIFKICQQNKFYSEIYTQIYAKIGSEYPIFLENILEESYSEFLNSFENIKYVNPNTNYDEFCNYNKTNELRKSAALFYVNLMKIGVFPRENILSCLLQLIDYVFLYISQENRVNEVEEITEIINVIYSNTHTVLSNEKEWEYIFEKIQILSQKKNTSDLSISNRAIFKFMDMVEL